MTARTHSIALALAFAFATGCHRTADAPAAAHGNASAAATSPDAHAPGDAAAPRDAATAHEAPAPANDTFTGRAEGRGADPPIREYTTRASADAWNGSGTATLTIDPHGVVSGRLEMSHLHFAVNGHREGARVTATLAQIVDDDSQPLATDPPTTESDGGGPEGVFRGMLDGEIEGTHLRARWEASAVAGVHRRNGSVDATRAN